MATASASAEPSRTSFAKVAASAGSENIPPKPFARAAVTMPLREFRKDNAQAQRKTEATESAASSTAERSTSASDIPNTNSQTREDESRIEDRAVPASAAGGTDFNLIDAMKAMEVNSDMPSLVVNGLESVDRSRKPYVADGFPEDLFQRTDSSSEMGTKPPSLDGKSVTSGTTFALDEKESLRPDDSASVKAAEDDDTFSGRGSIVAGSRMGSEAAARAYREYNPSERKLMQPMLERQVQGGSTPQSASSGQQLTDDGKPKIEGATGAPDAFNLFYRQTPDEKLLEALDSPKDRMFLLRLEQEVIEFVKDSKEPFIDLPPCNSFCRMLTHKLADYYHMTHQVDAGAVVGAVRIFRTPFCRLPAPLTTISNPPTTGNTPPPTMPTMKIMRRGGDTGPSPSKAASETGSDGKDKSLSAKEKLSREEREAAYNKARERIFGKDGDATPDTEEGNEMSRSSSVSTKDRAAQNKRPKPKQRRDDSDTFDVRSQYTPIFPQQQVQVPTWAPNPQYAPLPQQSFTVVGQSGYPNPVGTQYVSPQQYNPTAKMHTGNMQGYPMIIPQQYPQQSQQRFPSNSAPISAYGSPAQSPQIPHNHWQQHQQQPVYQGPYLPQVGIPRGPPSSVPYAFGQLPSTTNPADPKSQHPIPGSFNRHAFNPKTQSFVPGNSGSPLSQPISHHGTPHHGSPHHGSPHLAYNSYTPSQQFGNGMGYNMARQGSNNSLPSYHASPHMPHRPVMAQNAPQPQGVPHGLPQGGLHGMGHNIGQQSMHGMPSSVGNHLPNYGNASTLPPKPPTGV